MFGDSCLQVDRGIVRYPSGVGIVIGITARPVSESQAKESYDFIGAKGRQADFDVPSRACLLLPGHDAED
jgi:hypothetical protein